MYGELRLRDLRLFLGLRHLRCPCHPEAYSKIIINLLAIIFIVLVDLVFASERASETWYSLEMELCSERWSMGCLNKESPGKLVSKVWTLSQVGSVLLRRKKALST